jgi:hypothetical protein
MNTCLTCGDPTEDGTEFCSGTCFYEMESELETPLAGHTLGELVVEAAEAEARRAAGDA